MKGSKIKQRIKLKPEARITKMYRDLESLSTKIEMYRALTNKTVGENEILKNTYKVFMLKYKLLNALLKKTDIVVAKKITDIFGKINIRNRAGSA